MRKKKQICAAGLAVSFLIVSFFFLPAKTFAHEVYVLNSGEIAHDVAEPFHDPLGTIAANSDQFIEYGCLIAAAILASILFAISPKVVRVFSSPISRMKKYAPLIGRLTLGGSLVFSGYFNSIFGPELPLSTFGHVHILSILLMTLGVLIIVGLFTRLAALIALGIFALSVYHFHSYMFTYGNYLGEIIVSLIIGGGMLSLDSLFKNTMFGKVKQFFEQYSFLILRLCFGTALFYASFYAKFLHSGLALDTVLDYHLTNYFPFTPDFLVLGAFIVEALLGACFFFGIQIRFAAIVFTGFLILSISFFGESVWPHLILFGINIAMFLHGYDTYTLGYYLVKGKEHEPVL